MDFSLPISAGVKVNEVASASFVVPDPRPSPLAPLRRFDCVKREAEDIRRKIRAQSRLFLHLTIFFANNGKSILCNPPLQGRSVSTSPGNSCRALAKLQQGMVEIKGRLPYSPSQLAINGYT